MKIETFHLIDGARQAEGLTVIIDVFRAFSMECWLYALGAEEVRPVGSIEDTFAWREKDPGCVLVGERQGKKIDGCDLGNSPSSIDPETIRGKRIIHTTSAGTQGIVNAVHADEIITGSFVNAKAISEYIRKKSPEKVSLVCMGKAGLEPAEEDELCAVWLHSLLTGQEIVDNDDMGYSKDFETKMHQVIKKVSNDFENLKYNTAIAALMGLINDFFKKGSVTKGEFKTFITLLNPVAPHITEELWEIQGFEGRLYQTAWPEYDEAKTVEDTIEIAVQINGKTKMTIAISRNEEKDSAIEKAKEALGSKLAGDIVKEIYVPGRIINIVVKK